MEQTGKTICFTGPRPKQLFGYNRERYNPIVHFYKNLIRDAFLYHGYNRFLFGGAQGIDQLAFWAAYAVKSEGRDIKLVIYVPFKGQEESWSQTGPFSQSEYRQMLQKADEVKVICPELDRNDASVPEKDLTHMAVKALYERNHAMVDDSDLVYAFYPDESWMDETTRDGTAACMRYAMESGKFMSQIVYNPRNIAKTMHVYSEEDAFPPEEEE